MISAARQSNSTNIVKREHRKTDRSNSTEPEDAEELSSIIPTNARLYWLDRVAATFL